MERLVHVVTDSACDLPESVVDEHQIEVVPLTIRFDDEEFVDRIELTNEDFWTRMKSSPTLPSTAAPSPGAFEQAFRKVANGGSVICITISSKLSATYQAAMTAKEMVSKEIDVRVIDSQVCTVGQGILCLEAAQLAKAGSSADEAVAGVEDLASRIKIYGALDTLDGLRKGGRIGGAAAFFGTLLSVKPLITIQNGEVHPESRQRTRSKALTHLAKLVTSQAPVDHVAITHSQAADLDQFIELLKPVVSKDQILITDIGPVIGTHGGPGIIAVAFATSQ